MIWFDEGKYISRAIWKGGGWALKIEDIFGPWNGNDRSECQKWGPKNSDWAVPVSAKNVLCDVMRVVGLKQMYTYVYFVNICVFV
jgi:hypothetical protein